MWVRKIYMFGASALDQKKSRKKDENNLFERLAFFGIKLKYTS